MNVDGDTILTSGGPEDDARSAEVLDAEDIDESDVAQTPLAMLDDEED